MPCRQQLIEFACRAIEIPVPFVEQGRGWSGWDCWGLVCCAYRECLGLELPLYLTPLKDELTVPVMEAELSKWRKISSSLEQPWDMVVFRPCHVGLVVGGGRMFHAYIDMDTCIGDYRSLIWRLRILGFYRHARLDSN